MDTRRLRPYNDPDDPAPACFVRLADGRELRLFRETSMIFFDIDGTLLDDTAAVRAGVAAFLRAFKSCFPRTVDEFYPVWQTAADRHFQDFETGANSFWGQRRARMRELFDEEMTDAQADDRFRVFLRAYETNWDPFKDTLPCLKALQDLSLGVITNGDATQQRAKLDQTGLAERFQVVVVSGEAGCAKPDRAIFDLAAKRAGEDIKGCVYVGDRLKTDAQAAREAGMQGVWLDRGKWGGDTAGVSVINSLAELPALVLPHQDRNGNKIEKGSGW
jgi:putative hydrolase of the HAD superfamily